MVHKELYDILGVSPSADPSTIKKAYRVLAMKYHPDKNKNDASGEEKFKNITHAYSILSDPEKRKSYDMYGDVQNQPNGFEGFGGFGGFPGGFGGFNPFGGKREKISEEEYKITLEEIFTKTQIDFKYIRNTKCEDCNATGFSDKMPHICADCNGTGMKVNMVRTGNVIQQIQSRCNMCGGAKLDPKFADKKCGKCNSSCYISSERTIKVDVPENIFISNVTILEDQGDWYKNKHVDLHVVFSLKLSKGYSNTSENKLIYTMKINYPETIFGFRRIFDHPSGKRYLIVSDRGNIINPGNIYVIPGIGIGGDSMFLRLIVKTYPEKVLLPENNAAVVLAEIEPAFGKKLFRDENEADYDLTAKFNLGVVHKIDNSEYTKEKRARQEYKANKERAQARGGHGHGHGHAGVNGAECVQQ